MTTDTLQYKPLVKATEPVQDKIVYIPAAVAKKKQMQTLYVTDMPFTANSAVKANLPVIGYKGICDQYADSLSQLEPEFAQLLQKKKVHTVVLLYNADAVDPRFNPRVDKDRDLSKPLYNLFYAVKSFRDLLFSFDSDITLIYANLQHRYFMEGYTTIDDVAEQHGEKVFKSLSNFRAKSNAFLSSINISELSTNKLYNHLKLKNVHDFYHYHCDRLKHFEFTYKSVSYYHDGDKLEKLSYSDVKLYLRSGPDYYKRMMMLNPHGELEEIITPWKIGEVNRDYGSAFIKEIPRFDSFTNQPSNNGEYQRTVTLNHNGITSELYNLYNPVDWDPEIGEWPHIEMFLRHIFSAKNIYDECLYDWALDYMQLTYTAPRQRLPILALVSSERNTGKTTFLDLHKLIYGANITILDNARFNPKFTSHFAGKLIVSLDEGHIPVNDKITKEMIKSMATGREIWMEGKGTNAKPVANFAHLIFVSNDERNFMQIDAGENRFAVVKVPSFRKAGQKDIPDLLDKMKVEIPAFLHFLINRKLRYPKNETRFWFPDKVYLTEAFQAVVDKTKTTLEKELENWLNDSFLQFEVAELNFTLSEIATEVSREASIKFPKDKVRETLAEIYRIHPKLPKWYLFYSRKENGETVEEKRKGRCCTFYKEDWLTQDPELLESEEN
jgi:hypothetical protein